MLSKIVIWIWTLVGLLGLSILKVEIVNAQVTADDTLGTQVDQEGNSVEINGGTQAGSNLFHSFQEFSLETDATASFNNGTDISNIFSRVTGESTSHIDGLIRANGEANLILLNPQGINFGANATLDIGGSFLGSAADNVVFEDGTVFNSRDTQVEPMLTISAPIGLQLGQNPAGITVTGRSTNLSEEIPAFSQIIIGETSGLEVQQGQTLALVGGKVELNGATLTAPAGRVELGSVKEGTVQLNSLPQGWRLNYDQVIDLQDVMLTQASLINAGGFRGGSVQIQGKQITLQDGSSVIIQNLGEQQSGNLVVNAAESLEISGTNANGEISTSLLTSAFSNGTGGEIRISTPQLKILNGGVIFSRTFGNAKAGEININTTELEVSEFSPLSIRPSSIVSQTVGPGTAGNINISTGNLTASNGGSIASITVGQSNTGSAGQVNVNATESIQLTGIAPGISSESQITASTGSAGNAGTVQINTQNLVLRDGGLVDASTRATGNAGTVQINATNSLEIKGNVSNSLNSSRITADAEIVDPSFQELLQLPTIPSGNAGNIQITTSQLNLTDGAEVDTSTAGTGNSGSIQIDANSIFLSSNSGITSEIGSTSRIFANNESSLPEQIEFGGDANQVLPNVNTSGGDIKISTQVLSLNNGSSISTSTLTSSKGGDIIIDAENSIEIQGISALNPNMLSFISTSSFGTGNAGNLNLSTGKLIILDGSRVGAGTFGSASGGDITVRAESIEVIGSDSNQSVASLLGASSLGAGDAGNLTIDTTTLVVRDGGRVDSSATATGSAGNVDIRATESIDVNGFIPATSEPSLISSGVNVESETAQEVFQLPDIPSGNAGNVNIVTKTLNVTEQANVSVVNEGSGNGGTLQINADSVSLNNEGLLSAATESGIGGNISLAADTFLLRNNSATNANAGESGVGGNIDVETDNIGIFGNSQIIADAFMGMGGNIFINTNVFLSCGECQTTASSTLGIDGQVSIQTLQPNTQLEIVDIPLKLTQTKEDVAIACQTQEQNNSSELTISGRGGIPPRPQDPLAGESLVGLDNFSNSQQSKNSGSTTKKSSLPSPAQSWYRNSQGAVVLSASLIKPTKNNKLFNNANCHVN